MLTLFSEMTGRISDSISLESPARPSAQRHPTSYSAAVAAALDGRINNVQRRRSGCMAFLSSLREKLA